MNGSPKHEKDDKKMNVPVYPTIQTLEDLLKGGNITDEHRVGLDVYRNGGSQRYAQLAYLEAGGNITPPLKVELAVLKDGGNDREATLTRLELSGNITPPLQVELERLRTSRTIKS